MSHFVTPGRPGGPGTAGGVLGCLWARWELPEAPLSFCGGEGTDRGTLVGSRRECFTLSLATTNKTD